RCSFPCELETAHQLHDGGPADHLAGPRDRIHRQIDRAHRRSRQEHRRERRACGQGQGRAACDRRADPGRSRGIEKESQTMMPSILVVEDEPAIQELLRVNLEDAGFAVSTVADAEAALAQIKRALPDLVLLDWMLPGRSGLSLARGLRGESRTRDLPIIMVTARGDE